ncbi:MAG: hypothetical protein PHT07_10240 [Paludibacter sp.]|nr:hypothetical protein [Paludibacter sp.]
MRQSIGQIHLANKAFFDAKATEFIEKHLASIGSVCYPPDGMKTHYSRRLIKKIGDDSFMFFTGYVSNIVEIDEVLSYEGEAYAEDTNSYVDREEAINRIGFGLCFSNRYLDQLKKEECTNE